MFSLKFASLRSASVVSGGCALPGAGTPPLLAIAARILKKLAGFSGLALKNFFFIFVLWYSLPLGGFGRKAAKVVNSSVFGHPASIGGSKGNSRHSVTSSLAPSCRPRTLAYARFSAGFHQPPRPNVRGGATGAPLSRNIYISTSLAA